MTDERDKPKYSRTELLTDIFGEWPLFEGAELHSLSVSVTNPAIEIGPTIDLILLTFASTGECDENKELIKNKPTLTHLRFHEVINLSLSNFCPRNLLSCLEIWEPEPDMDEPRFLKVRLQPGIFGVFECSFQSSHLEVVSASPCEPK